MEDFEEIEVKVSNESTAKEVKILSSEEEKVKDNEFVRACTEVLGSTVSDDEIGAGDKDLKIESHPAFSALMDIVLKTEEMSMSEATVKELHEELIDLIEIEDVEDLHAKKEKTTEDCERDTSTVPQCPVKKPEHFTYKDVDSLNEELCELYGYYEMSSFSMNKDSFELFMERKQFTKWGDLTEVNKVDVIQAILEDCEVAIDRRRYDAILALNYLAQGCWGEFDSVKEQLDCIVENVKLMIRSNVFWTVWMAFKLINSTIIDLWNRGRKEQILEGCLNILGTILLVALDQEHNELYFLLDDLLMELRDTGIENFFMELMRFIVRVSEFNISCYMLKKVLILLRFYLLLTLGGSDKLREEKLRRRTAAGLKSSTEDTILTCENIGILQDTKWWKDGAQRKLLSLSDLQQLAQDDGNRSSANKGFRKKFPWSPKSSLESFSDIPTLISDHSLRTHKFQSCLVIPSTIKQKTELLVKHLYIPLGDFQKEGERLLSKYPALFGNQEEELFSETETTDKLFAALVQRLDDILDVFRDILVQITPRRSLRTLNYYFIPNDADPTFYEEDRYRQSEIVLKSLTSIILLLLKHFKLNHIYQFECIATEMVTAAFIPTIMRFFTRDLSLYLSKRPTYGGACCLFKVMRVERFPFDDAPVVQENGKKRESSSTQNMNSELIRRNLFAYTNLLRILNKLVKGNPCRIRSLFVLHPLESFKRALNIRDPFIQQFLLKLIKQLCRYEGAEWKKNNLQIVTAIFYKVRHRILDNWLGETSLSSRGGRRQPKLDQISVACPWDYSGEELKLVKSVIHYIQRRFGDIMIRKSKSDQEDEQDEGCYLPYF